jgi:ATP-dependent Clp protease ATP-binding subunit ClpA
LVDGAAAQPHVAAAAENDPLGGNTVLPDMSRYNFTEHLRLALRQAREASEDRRTGYVGPEHLLLGVLGHPDREAQAALHVLNAEPGLLLKDFSATLAPGNETSRGADTPYTKQGKQVLEAAMREAASLGHHYVGCEHLLLGLVATPSAAADFLQGRGIEHGGLRTAIIRVLGTQPEPTGSPSLPNTWTTASTARLALIVAVLALLVAIMALIRLPTAE